jgi:hypothetical protein
LAIYQHIALDCDLEKKYQAAIGWVVSANMELDMATQLA